MVQALVISIVFTAACVAIHYNACSFANWRLRKRHRGAAGKMTVIFVTLFVAHYLEITLYALGLYIIYVQLGLGEMAGQTLNDFADHLYFSAVVYTSLGFGDIVPLGPMRIVVAFEALTGLMMITWSASFAFLNMPRAWQHDGHEDTQQDRRDR